MYCAIAKASNTASPKPVTANGPTSYVSGWCSMARKRRFMGVVSICGSCRDARQRHVGESRKIERGALTLLEAEKPCTCDHRGVVGSKARGWYVHLHVGCLATGSHRCDE